MASRALPRLGLNQRLQHAALAAAVLAAILAALVERLAPSLAGSSRAVHAGAGVAALAVLGYHLVYLAVRGYVEGQGWGDFPLRWSAADSAAAVAGLRRLAGGGPRPPEGDHRPTRKVLYWWTTAAVGVAGATGLGIARWEGAGTIGSLAELATLHRGFALLLLASVLWHLYGALTWEGSWAPEWSWITGGLDEETARLKLPDALRRHREREAKEEEAGAVEEAGAQQGRVRREREEVEAELERGNRLALEERYVEAVYHYRRALELYPGYSQARYNMARVLARMGEREAAREAYRLFLEADPFHPLARKAQEAIAELSRRSEAP